MSPVALPESPPIVLSDPSSGPRAREERPDEASVWWIALALFVVAGGTGALFRMGMVYGWTGGLELENIRHAHSHLMYFGWGTPALMALIWGALPTRRTAPRQSAFRWVVGATLVAAVLAYPLFLLFGYAPVSIGGARLPIAVIGAGLNILGWYGFVGLYVVTTYGLPRRGPLPLWDGAVGALVLATLGAWGLSLLPLFGVENALLATALTHAFLDLFSEGWFVLGMLGVAFGVLGRATEGPRRWSLGLVALGLPCAFLLGLPVSQLPLGLELVGRASGVMVGTGLLAMGLQLVRGSLSRRDRWLWGVPLACLLLKAAAQGAGSLVPGLWLGAVHGVRILYLHLMLLGFLSLGLVAGARAAWGGLPIRRVGLLYGTVVLVLLTLVPLTPWGPGGPLAYEVAAWAALGPVLLGTGLLVGGETTSRAVAPGPA